MLILQDNEYFSDKYTIFVGEKERKTPMKRYDYFLTWLTTMLLALLLAPTSAAAFENNTGELTNLVCFVRFADEAETDKGKGTRAFEQTVDVYQQLFNDEAADANSVYNYFRTASYGQLLWRSTFYPQQEGEHIVSMQVSHNRTYYEQKSSVATDGYEDETERANRELTLVTEICNTLNRLLPNDVVIDKNGDGFVDNLTIILSNGSEVSNKHLLWPHRSDMALPEDKALRIKEKKMVSYLMVFDYANGYGSQFNPLKLNTGVLCHEMSHSLGTYDLYHLTGSLNPVGVWDLMSDNQQQAQQMTAYTKWRYCKWLSEIPLIKEAGTYELNPVGGTAKEKIAYKIQPVGHDEYFVVEYRRKQGFDRNLPGEGLIVYRINPAYSGGNVNYNGTTRLDEQYIFRPGGTPTADGQLSQAALSAESGRTGIGGTASLQPFYSDGSPANFIISNVGTCGETITFTLEASERLMLLSTERLKLAGQAHSAGQVTLSTDADWQATGVPDWLTLQPAAGQAGNHVITLTTVSENSGAQSRTAEITFCATDDPTFARTLTVTQASALISAPEGLRAEDTEGGVSLTWQPVAAGKTLFFDDFENTANPYGWTIENAGDRGWQYTEGKPNTGYRRVYEGTHAMTMVEAWEDLHQDERLTTPVFAYGRTLEFYSRCNGGNATPKVNPPVYIIEVSSDGGQTWYTVFDVLKDYPRDAEGNTVSTVTFTKITIDLSAYMSAAMQVRFHCYDTSNEGLQYWWQIDNLSIIGDADDLKVTAYNVYRNGVLLATVSTPAFVDQAPLAGESIYTVTACGTFGESSESEAVAITATAGIRASTLGSMGAAAGIYSIGGQRLPSVPTQGIYIQDGRKYRR